MKVPFNHHTIPNSTGLFVIYSDTSLRPEYYTCDLCSYKTNASRSLVRHASSEKHVVTVWEVMNRTEINQVPLATGVNDDLSDLFDNSKPSSFDDDNDLDLRGFELPKNLRKSSLTKALSFDDNNHLDDYKLPSMDNTSYDDYKRSSIDNTLYDVTSPEVIQSTISNLFDDSDNSFNHTYYTCQTFNRNGRAVILAQSLLHSSSFVDIVTEEDIDLHYFLFDLLMNMSTKEREKMARFLQLLHIRIESLNHIFSNLPAGISVNSQDNTDNQPFVFPIPLPTSTQEIRTKYTRGENSIFNNLPSVQIKEGKRHAYVSIADCLGHYFASGGSIMPYTSMCTAAKLKCNAIKKDNKDASVVFINLWSDGFEPNTTKVNRSNSRWVVSMTIISEDIHKGEYANTFPIGICRSKDMYSQDIIFGLIISEINILAESPSQYYSTCEGRVLNVYTSVLSILQDQPERRKRCYMLLGNSQSLAHVGVIYCPTLKRY